MYKDPNSYSMQLQVPHSIYGACTYFIPKPLLEWLAENNLKEWGYIGGTSSGNGFTDGVNNQTSTYMVYNIKPEDATVFKIHFPHVQIYLAEPYNDYSETKTNTRTKSTRKSNKETSRSRRPNQVGV